MSKDKKKKSKSKSRAAKRGSTPTTLVVATPKKATFVDPQPPDRYNLVFFADYSDADAALELGDDSFVHLYHDDFPAALNSYTVWTSKEPGSRSHCKADLIKKVSSLADIVQEIKHFIAGKRNKPKKFGTIILAGHGNPQEFSLPLAKSIKNGGKRTPLPLLEIGLRHVGALTDTPPSDWPSTPDVWVEFRDEFMRLQIEIDSLHNTWQLSNWTDEQTLMRMWCCNLGKTPKPGAKDALLILGKIFFGKAKFMIEAPQNKSGNQYLYWNTKGSSPDKFRKDLFRKEKKKDGLWHPDAIAEVESDSTLTLYTGSDLAQAQADFVTVAFRPPPDPHQHKAQWIPAFYVEDNNRKKVFPQDWAKFSALWRQVKQ